MEVCDILNGKQHVNIMSFCQVLMTVHLYFQFSPHLQSGDALFVDKTIDSCLNKKFWLLLSIQNSVLIYGLKPIP